MENKELLAGLEELLKNFLSARGYELVEMSSGYQGQDLVLRLAVDKPDGGITVGELGKANRGIRELLEEKGLTGESFTVEVNSPGLDRPLKSKADFRRCAGRQVKFFLIQPINGKIEIDGVILGVTEDGVQAKTSAGDCFIPLSRINKAKQIL